MTFTSLCEHLERRCGVAASATLRARVAAVSIDPVTLDWQCSDSALMTAVNGIKHSGGALDRVAIIFHLDIMRTEFEKKPQRIGGTVFATNPSTFEPNCIDDNEDAMDGHATMSGPPLTAEQESLEAES